MRKVLIHPRKVRKVMKNFLEKASPLTYVTTVFPSLNECEQNGWNWMEMFDHGEEKRFPKTCTLTKIDKFAAYCGSFFDEDTEETSFFEIGYDGSFDFSGEGNIAFYVDFVSRCPLARGFGHITLSLLHELGHFVTAPNFQGYDRCAAMIELRNKAKENNLSISETNKQLYFRLPEETAATDWAIMWLQDKENRKIAKAFEKQFFACFKDA